MAAHPFPNTLEEFEAHLSVDRHWTLPEIRVAVAGWEWAFDTGRDQEDADEDAARDLAASFASKRDLELMADCAFEGIKKARAAQFSGGAQAFAEHRAKEREKLIAELKAEIAAGRLD